MSELRDEPTESGTFDPWKVHGPITKEDRYRCPVHGEIEPCAVFRIAMFPRAAGEIRNRRFCTYCISDALLKLGLQEVETLTVAVQGDSLFSVTEDQGGV